MKTLLMSAASFVAAVAPTPPPYPAGYRGWMHVRSGVIGPESKAFARFGGIHDIYANPLALRGYDDGHFANGSVIVFDVHALTYSNGNGQVGARKQIDVMMKRNGAWRFVEFSGSTAAVTVDSIAGATGCEACHQQAPRDFVFSSMEN